MIKIMVIKLYNIIMVQVLRIFPRKNNFVIGGWLGERFADNSKALFLYMSKNKEKFDVEDVFYATKNPLIIKALVDSGFNAGHTFSLNSIMSHIYAKYHFIDISPSDINRYLSSLSCKVNLWHGFPLKKIGFYINDISNSVENSIEYNNKEIQVGEWQNSFILSYSNEMTKNFRFSFGKPQDKILRGIYPRDYYMLSKKMKFYLPSELRFKDKIELLKKQGIKIIIYLPTFRDKVEQNDEIVNSINKLSFFLKEKKYCLVTKLHYVTKTNVKITSDDCNIINLAVESDVYNFLELADLLITDYSSVYFDFLFFDKPIVFYPFDFQYYNNYDRGFLYPYAEFTPGDKVFNASELKSSIAEALDNVEAYNKQYNEQKEKIMKIVYDGIYPSEENMEKLIKEILKISQ